MALWGGRFTQAADQRFKQFNDSLRFDYRLAEQDIVAEADGVIAARHQEEGNRLMPGSLILTTEDTSSVRLIMQLPQDAASKIKLGQKVILKT